MGEMYAVRMRHDSGTVVLRTFAEDSASAAVMVARAEGAPLRSVVDVWSVDQARRQHDAIAASVAHYERFDTPGAAAYLAVNRSMVDFWRDRL